MKYRKQITDHSCGPVAVWNLVAHSGFRMDYTALYRRLKCNEKWGTSFAAITKETGLKRSRTCSKSAFILYYEYEKNPQKVEGHYAFCYTCNGKVRIVNLYEDDVYKHKTFTETAFNRFIESQLDYCFFV